MTLQQGSFLIFYILFIIIIRIYMAKIIITENMLRNIFESETPYEVNEGFGQYFGEFMRNVFGQQGNQQPSRQSSMVYNQGNVTNTPSQNFITTNGVDRNCLDFIAFEENSRKFKYQMPQRDLVGWINKRDKPANDGIIHKTYGYGLVYTPDGKQFMDRAKPVPVYTQQELENLFVDSVNRRAAEVSEWANKNNVNLGRNQFNAMVSAVYNYGKNGFFNKVGRGLCAMIARNPNDKNIPQEWAKLRANPNRRKREAALYAQDIPYSGLGGGNSGSR